MVQRFKKTPEAFGLGRRSRPLPASSRVLTVTLLDSTLFRGCRSRPLDKSLLTKTIKTHTSSFHHRAAGAPTWVPFHAVTHTCSGTSFQTRAMKKKKAPEVQLNDSTLWRMPYINLLFFCLLVFFLLAGCHGAQLGESVMLWLPFIKRQGLLRLRINECICGIQTNKTGGLMGTSLACTHWRGTWKDSKSKITH